MIVAITIQNFKSLRETTSVSFGAGNASSLPGNLLKHSNGERFVKSMALFGKNASGKTTVLDALHALGSFVLFSSQDQKPTSSVPHFRPFALDRSSKDEPSRIAIVLDLGGDRYTFDVAATRERVWRETLVVQRTVRQPSRKAMPKTLIERSWNPAKSAYATSLHAALGPELTRSAAIEQTTPNRLMLGKLASLNNDIARRIVEWVEVDLDFYDMHRNPNAEEAMLTKTARLLKDDADFAAIVGRFLGDADTGIERLELAEEKEWQIVPIDENEKKGRLKSVTVPTLSFQHTTEDGSVVRFRKQRESSGTRRFVALLTAVLQPGPRRRLVCIDELSASLHPDLVRRLIKIVHSGAYNKAGNQLLFTTHDTHLMEPRELLRRDQITICDKDQFGRSTTTRLDSYHDAARSDANLQKQYLQGRFNGKPQFGPTLEDVPVDDEPLPVNP